MKSKRVRSEVTEDRITITIPIDTLVCAFDRNPTNVGFYKVKNRDEFAKDFAKYLNTYHSQSSAESGITALEEFLDELGSAMCEDAVDSIDYLGE